MKLNKRIAHALGYDIVRLHKGDFSPETHLKKIFDRFGIDLVLDVGANKGQFGERLRKAGYGGDIHSFEPIGFIFQELQAAGNGDERWHAHNCALGAAQGNQTINIMSGTDFSSFLNPSDFGKIQFAASTQTQGQETVTVDTVADFLAAHVPDYTNRRIFLKMDTQGYDLEVFKGAIDAIGSVKGLLSELSLIPIYDGMPDYIDVLKAYQGQGFTPSGFYPVSRDTDGLALVELDCVLVRTA